MKKFLVALQGENLLLEVRGEKAKYGFHTKRYVEAESVEEAEMNALMLIFNDKNLQKTLANTQEDPPAVTAGEITEVTRPLSDDHRELKIEYYREEE
jgi:hypothetical protein